MLLLHQVSKVDPSMPQEDAKAHLMSKIDTYIQVRLKAAAHLPSVVYQSQMLPDLLPHHLQGYKPAICGTIMAPCRRFGRGTTKTGSCCCFDSLQHVFPLTLLCPAAQEKIVFADDMLVGNAVAKIDNGDVILTYAYSTVVFDILVKAHQVGRSLSHSTLLEVYEAHCLRTQMTASNCCSDTPALRPANITCCR